MLCFPCSYKDQGITGSVFVDLTKEAIDSLGFNFGARNILPKVLNQVIYSQNKNAVSITQTQAILLYFPVDQRTPTCTRYI